MKNVTITLDEKVARWARVKAAELDKSLSRFIAELLTETMQHEAAYEQAMRSYLSAAPRSISTSAKYPKRDELYDRPVLRRL
ncbi:MAG: hypothetical protein AB7U38_11640 [Hyphomicrobiales bacterium]